MSGSPPSEAKPLTELLAWVMVHPNGAEGLIASSRLIPGMLMPLVGGDKARMESLREEARSVARMAGLPLKLVRFGSPEVLERFEPAGTPAPTETVQ